MTIRVALHHRTVYRFDRLVGLSPHEVRLRPAPHCRTPIHSFSLRVRPETHFLNWQQDAYGNYIARLVFPDKADTLEVTVDLVADMTVINPFDFFVEHYAETFPFRYPDTLATELAPYLQAESAGPLLARLLTDVRANELHGDGTVSTLVRLNQRVQRDIEYLVRMEPGVHSPEETLERARGSCRDSGWLLVQMLRHLGLAARFVSGYLIQLAPDVKPLDGPAGPVADFTDLHAWAEVYLPGAGWIGLDPTSGMLAGEGHIPLAATAFPSSAAPISGFTEVCESTLEFDMHVTRIHEDPRVTKPYTEAQWNEIDALGRQVDRELEALDVRLTHGGEPTFVSIDDMDGPEWNYTALSDTKWRLAEQLAWRLYERFARGGLVFYGQGKWYPGEPLPRWAIGVHWRRDGAPLWSDPSLIAHEADVPHADAATAQQFATTIAVELGLNARTVLAAYEDPLRSTSDAEKPAGYVLPLRMQDGAWQTSTWPLQQGHLFLMPGDSPLGYRLPLGSLPAGEDFVRTALCVQMRADRLHVFMPPLDTFGDFIDLIALIERIASRLHAPVRIEGYPPADDARLHSLHVTPDPGVIEVNVHPAASWDELAHNTDVLYEEARLTRLGAEKFMLDGRHTGTGGGNHVTLGGATAAASPFLRRPDLLKSIIAYWQNHPALSYLFAGMFVGPTSQAPRADEARDDSLYELEIAFQQIDAHGSAVAQGSTHSSAHQPDFVDRVLRNLLADVTGNTHRAELCIDKLYSSDSARGRLGLLELRAFEMPPHPRMSLVQMLLVRALVAHFWRSPYRGRLVNWDTQLHDRWMLPHFLQQDIRDVAIDLRAAGFAFKEEWFAPFAEFRFPRFGTVSHAGVELELRQAIEPWHVLADQVATSGTSRYVDSSVERLQVKVRGMTGQRHVVACNGRAVPLHPTGVPGEFVAGVRFKAWNPPSALHPTIGVHTPLVFDIVDTWSGRAIGGCTYHATHPGGRNYETFPVNANEAEARRFARFWDHGHTPGTMHVAAEPLNRSFPLTLDLRFVPS